MSMHNTIVEAAEPLLDPDTAAFVRTIQRQGAWRIFPYGEWLEHGGSRVIFDRQYRPICRVYTSGSIEFLQPATCVSYTHQRLFHRGFGPSPDAETRAAALNVMQSCHGMEAELRRRRDLEKRGLLPRRATDPNTLNSVRSLHSRTGRIAMSTQSDNDDI